MNHDGTQQYAFGYGLANTPQIQLQQQQMQLQQQQLQQHQQQQILQHQGNPAISQSLYQLQLGSSPTALLQHNENPPMALAQGVHTGNAQHGIISQPVIQASMSVSLDKSLHGLGNLDAVMYPSQNNGYKIISNSGNFVQQSTDAIMGVRPAFHGVDALGKSNVIEGMASQGNVYTFGKQSYSGWMQQNDMGGHHATIGGQSSLPSFSHLWSQFQQQKTHVSIVPRQQQQQQLNQFQPSAPQIHGQFQHPQLSHLQQPQQQFTVSGIQSVPSIQMIKVQQNSVPEQAVYQSTSLVQQCGTTAPVQLNQSVQNQANLTLSSNPLPNIPAQQQNLSLAQTAFNQQQLQPGTSVPSSQDPFPIVNTVTLQQRDSLQANFPVIPTQDGALQASSINNSVVRNVFPPHTSVPSSCTISENMASKEKNNIIAQPSPPHSIINSESSTSPDTVKIQTVASEAFSESGPPKVTVTLDSLTNCQNLSEFPKKEDLMGDLCHDRAITRNEKVSLKGSNHTQPFFPEKKGPAVPRLLKLTSSTGSSLDRPSSEDSSFSSPPYSFTPPSSLDSAFSPPPFSKTIPDSQTPGMSGSNTPYAGLSPLQPPSSVFSSFLPPVPLTSSPAQDVSKGRSSMAVLKSSTNKINSCDAQYSDLRGSLPPSGNILPTSLSSPLISASCCSNALTTTSVTLSSPQTNGGMAVASVHSFTPLSSPGSVVSHVQPTDVPLTLVSGQTDNWEQKSIKVPYSWERKCADGAIVYLSPSRALLTSLDEIRDYLLSDDTCKCGLECPLQLEKAFSFDVDVENQPWEASPDNIMKFCRHRRDIMAVAAFHRSQTQAQQSVPGVTSAFRKRRESKQSLGTGEDLIVTPPKRLKKSITKAVNKHALSRSNSTAFENPLAPKKVDLQPSHPTPASSSQNPILVATNECEESVKATKSPPASDKGALVPDSVYQHSAKVSQLQLTSSSSLPQLNSVHVSVAKKGSSQLPDPSHFLSAVSSEFSQGSNLTPTKEDLQTSVSSGCSSVSTASCTSSLTHSGKDNSSSWTSSNVNLPTSMPPLCTLSGTLTSKSSTIDSHRLPAMFISNQPKCQPPGSPLSAKPKSKNPKGRKEKQLKSPTNISTPIAMTSRGVETSKNSCLLFSNVSFLENPTVFVAQQAAIINNSIASCQVDGCISDPPVSKPDCADTSLTYSGMPKCGKGEFVPNDETEELADELDISKDEEDNKASTDVESNKSFSDTTENNDSAYLSQAGSDQEKSDTVDGMDCSLKSSDIYDFNSSEDQLESSLSLGNLKTPGMTLNVDSIERSRRKEKRTPPAKDHSKVIKEKDSHVSDKQSITSSNSKLKNVTGKMKLSTVSTVSFSCSRKMGSSLIDSKPCEDVKMNRSSSLNGDLSHLLASGNWNIPALQKVLAKHSVGDPNGLNAAIQQVLAQVSDSTTHSLNCHIPAKSLIQEKTETIVSNHNCKGETKTSTKKIDVKNKLIPEKQLEAKKLQSGELQESSGTAIKKLSPSGIHTSERGSSPGTKSSVLSSEFTLGKDKPALETICSESGQAQLASKPPNVIASAAVSSTPSTVLNISIASNCTLGSKITAQCSPHGSAVMLNNFNPQVMSVNTPMPPVSVSIVTNVTKSVTQVIPNLGYNQTVLGTQQFLNPRQNPTATAQFVNAAAATATPQGSHLVSPSSQSAQLMNALSIPGLNTSLVIANPIQQASPSNSVTQLSPAMAGQILAQSQQPLQQMSPSFVPAQIPKQAPTSVIANHSVSTSSSPVSLTVNPNSGEVPCSVPQANLFGSTFHKSSNVTEIQTNCFENKEVLNLIGASHAASISQSGPIANPSLYPTVSQSLFVIPQAKAAPVMQLLSSSQPLNGAAPRQGDMTHLMNQTGVTDQSQQLQNLIATGFNPLTMQQAWNTVSLGAQQQQQQQQQQQHQLQLLQLQQLMFPLIQSQNQGLAGVAQNANQATGTLAPQTLMNAVMAQQNLQLNQVVDVKSIQPNLSPVAAASGYANPALSPVAQGFPNTIQQLPSPITVHQVNGGNPSLAINPQGTSLSNAMNILQTGKTSSTVQTAGPPTDPPTPVPSHSGVTQPLLPCQKADGKAAGHENSSTPPQLTSSKSTTTSAAVNKAPQATKSASKSKSKSKKSDGNKIKDPQATKDEEHIATAVQQILAQAVQQQRELNLAAKNQPPPPPKSRSRKRDSQARARNTQANKEIELGKLASISDDVVEKTAISYKAPSFSHPANSMEVPFATSSLLLNPSQPKNQPSASKQGCVNSQSFSHPIQPVDTLSPGSLHLYNAPQAPKTPTNPTSAAGHMGGGEQGPGENSGSVNPVSKKNNISLREHLSSIISSKDKENGKKKQEKGDNQVQSRTKVSHPVSMPPALVNGDPTSEPPKIVT